MTPPTADALVERATEVRERLFSSIEALDRKRHALTSPTVALQHSRPWLLAGAVVATLAAAGLAVNVYRRRAVRARRVEVMRGAAFSLGTLLAAEVTRFAVRRLRAGLT